MDLSPDMRQMLLDAACEIIRRRLQGDAAPLALPSDPQLSQHAGCFVSLHGRESHHLRGCIGMVDTGRTVADALASAAESVLEDPRFADHPVVAEELPDLEVEVTFLGPLRAVASPLDFDPLNDGIYLTIGERTGLFLPQVGRETGWSREQLLARLCTEKMGLPAGAWKRAEARLEIFPSIIIGPQACIFAVPNP